MRGSTSGHTCIAHPKLLPSRPGRWCRCSAAPARGASLHAEGRSVRATSGMVGCAARNTSMLELIHPAAARRGRLSLPAPTPAPAVRRRCRRAAVAAAAVAGARRRQPLLALHQHQLQQVAVRGDAILGHHHHLRGSRGGARAAVPHGPRRGCRMEAGSPPKSTPVYVTQRRVYALHLHPRRRLPSAANCHACLRPPPPHPACCRAAGP